jgi:hypothetical protein
MQVAKLTNRRCVRIIALAICAGMLVTFAACRRKREVTPPQTYAVSGKIVSAAGRKIPADYRLVFEPADPERAASGTIGPDGSFSLETIYMGVRCEGAAQGEYQIAIVPPLNLATQGASAVMLPEKIKIEPRANELTVRIP